MVNTTYIEQNNPFPVDNPLDVARELYTEQFKNKPVFDKYVQLLLTKCIDVRSVLEQVQRERSIHTALGAQLENIGDIVGRPRGVIASDMFTYFGFSGLPSGGSPPPKDPSADTYGSIVDNTIGSPWFSLKSEVGKFRPPTDEEYRLLIKAKILQNNTIATPEEVINAYRFLFNVGVVDIQEIGNATVNIRLGKILSVAEKALIYNFGGLGGLLPKPLGVKYNYSEFDDGRLFATCSREEIEGGGFNIVLYGGGEFETGLSDIYDLEKGGMLSNQI